VSQPSNVLAQQTAPTLLPGQR
ncbi:MAG: hypothetical protein RLZZ180_2190, partial [Pseudomonadota bacterium]